MDFLVIRRIGSSILGLISLIFFCFSILFAFSPEENLDVSEKFVLILICLSIFFPSLFFSWKLWKPLNLKDSKSFEISLSDEKKIRVYPEPNFPLNIFIFRNYNAWKALTAIILILSLIYFLTGFWGFLSIQNGWIDSVSTGNWITNFFHPIGNTVQKVSSTLDIIFRFFIFLCSYCLAWSAFDTKSLEGLMSGVFNIALGMIYIVSPTDIVPDFLPIVGNADDTLLSTGLILLGVSSFFKASKRKESAELAVQLMKKGSLDNGLSLILKEGGYTIDENK